MDTYDIYLGQEPVGTAQVEVEGLYYRFRCQCRLSGQVMYRLVVMCSNRQENLGVLIPEGDGFSLTSRVAIKRLGKGVLEFRLLPKHSQLNGQFVPLIPEEPFAYIRKIKESYLARKNGKLGIVIPE